jgi:thioredoxin-dependent peroxiredoxin
MKNQIIGCLLFLLSSGVLSAQQSLAVGDKVPEFKLTADNGSIWNINEFLGKKNIVVYFFPAAMTSGCTKEACSYRDRMADMQSADVVVVGISGDKIENMKLFKQSENLNFTLLSDEKGDVAKLFGVPIGGGGSIKRTVGGIEHELVRGVTAQRWTFIVGKDRKIIYKNETVNAEKDSEEVLNFIKLQAIK